MLRLLVERGGDVNITDDDGETPLFVVESVNLARLLIELGANPRHTSAEGLTVRLIPLFLSICAFQYLS